MLKFAILFSIMIMRYYGKGGFYMSYGLLDQAGNVFIPEKIDCSAEVTGDFGLFKLVHRYVCSQVKTAESKFVFPVTEIISQRGYSDAVPSVLY